MPRSEARLAAYNNEHATMNLVLFDDAVLHVCRGVLNGHTQTGCHPPISAAYLTTISGYSIVSNKLINDK